MSVIEIWGYLSMLVVIWSVTLKNIKSLRIVNSISCIMFIIYGLALGAYPIVLMNSMVIVINMWRVLRDK